MAELSFAVLMRIKPPKCGKMRFLALKKQLEQIDLQWEKVLDSAAASISRELIGLRKYIGGKTPTV